MVVEDIDRPYDDLVDITSSVIKKEVLLDLPNVTIFKSPDNSYYSEIFVTVGGVYYPAQVSTGKFLSLFKDTSTYAFAFKAPIGKLDIPMSREELLQTSNNDLVLSKVVEAAIKDVDDYIKSLDINLDVSLVDFYNDLANSSNHLKSSVNFKIQVSKETFEDKDADLKAYLEKFSYIGTGTVYRILNSSDICADLLQFMIYHSNTSIVVSSSGSNFEKYQSDFRHYNLSSNTAPTFVLTDTKLPSGISRVSLLNYFRDSLNIENDIVIIQTPEEFHKDFELIHNVIEAFYMFKVKEKSVYLGTLDETALRDYIKQIKENLKANRVTNVYTRSSLDYIPGLRIESRSTTTFDHSLKACCRFSDDKVNALVDSLGKRVPFGPEYLDSSTQTNVFLTSDNILPITLCDDLLVEDLNDSVRSFSFKLPSNSVVVKVASGSYDAVVKRFADNTDFTLYTRDNLHIIERPSLDFSVDGSLVFRPMMKYLSSLLSEELYSWYSTRRTFYEDNTHTLSSYVSELNFKDQSFKDNLVKYIKDSDPDLYTSTSVHMSSFLKVYPEFSEKECREYMQELYNKICEEEYKGLDQTDLYNFANTRSKETFEKALEYFLNNRDV